MIKKERQRINFSLLYSIFPKCIESKANIKEEPAEKELDIQLKEAKPCWISPLSLTKQLLLLLHNQSQTLNL